MDKTLIILLGKPDFMAQHLVHNFKQSCLWIVFSGGSIHSTDVFSESLSSLNYPLISELVKSEAERKLLCKLHVNSYNNYYNTTKIPSKRVAGNAGVSGVR